MASLLREYIEKYQKLQNTKQKEAFLVCKYTSICDKWVRALLCFQKEHDFIRQETKRASVTVDLMGLIALKMLVQMITLDARNVLNDPGAMTIRQLLVDV